MSEPTQVSELLAIQNKQLTQLLALLVKEKDILTQHDPQLLIEVTDEKKTLLSAIESIETSLTGSESFLADKASGNYQVELEQLSILLQECKRQNELNGAIIEKSNLAVERMKTSLLQQHSKSSMTYDSKGKTSGGLSSVGIKA